MELATQLAAHAPSPVRILNIGGGFGIPYFPGEKPLDVAPIAATLVTRLAEVRAAMPEAKLVIELGRYIVGEAGIYVCRVVDRKISRGQVFLVTDGGLHHHLAASGNFGQVLRKNYPVVVANRVSGGEREIASVVGPLCTPLDLLADRMELARADERRPDRRPAERRVWIDGEPARIPQPPRAGGDTALMLNQVRNPHNMFSIPGIDRDAHGKPIIGLDDASVYAFGHLVRSTEMLILDLFGRGLLSGTTHTCLGQELCQMSVVRALDHADDVVLSNHRNHGHFMTYSGHFLGLVAEIMGREAGVCRGYGGSQHMAFRHFHSNGVQAGMTGIASGLGLSLRQRGSKGIVAVMIGDGTMGEGMLYESMNLASIWQAPVLFVVENNGIAQTTLTSKTLGGSIAARGKAFGLTTWELDDAAGDFLAAAEGVVRSVRHSGSPGMLVINTRRMGPHSKGDDLRDEEEKRAIAARDPLAAIGRRLPAAQRAEIEARTQALLAEVEKQAMASPESRFAEVPQHAFRAALPATNLPLQNPKAANVRGAINAALTTLLEKDERVIVLGEDLHEPYGGAFKVTAGLSAKHPERVISTPISEAGICGAGIGLALAGRRPVVEIMFADFLSLCTDQLYNHAVKFPAMFEDVEVPLVVRTPCGGRRGYGPTHSQSPENIFVSVPGLTVVYGSHRHNVGQLLSDLVTRWPNPTLFLEHKLLYGEAQDPSDYAVVPADAQDHGAELFPTLRRGDAEPDVTLVAFGGMLPMVEKAARKLSEQEQLRVEIVAPSLLAPLPRNTLLDALLDRPRIVVIEESHHEYGFSAELLACLAESGYRGELLRIGTPAVPIASARSLERAQLPDEDAIVASILDLL